MKHLNLSDEAIERLLNERDQIKELIRPLGNIRLYGWDSLCSFSTIDDGMSAHWNSSHIKALELLRDCLSTIEELLEIVARWQEEPPPILSDQVKAALQRIAPSI